MKEDKEIRCYTCEFRAVEPDNQDSRMVEGYAAVYNSDSEYMGFVERIEPGAFDGVIERLMFLPYSIMMLQEVSLLEAKKDKAL